MSKYSQFAAGIVLAVAASFAWAAKPVANAPPTVTLTSPANGATFAAPATVNLTADANDTNGTITKVDFYRGTTLIGTSTARPYGVVWANVAAGSYSLTAKATDNGGAVTTSTAVAITVAAPNNNVVISTPANGATVYATSVTVSGTFVGATSTSAVWVDNGASSRLAALNGNAYTATVPLYVGTNTLTVTVARTDKTSDKKSITVMGSLPVQVVFKTPLATVFSAPANIALEVDAISPTATIASVNFYKNGALLGSATSPPYQYNWANVPRGNYTVSATATDSSGQAGSAALPITVNAPNVPPTISLTLPANNAVFSAPATINLAAAASDSDGTIGQVEFFRNGQLLSTTNVVPYAHQLTNVSTGTYTFTARATDNEGAVAMSAPVAVAVTPPNSIPTVTLTSPQAGTTTFAPASIVLNASPADSDGSIAQVEFFQGLSFIGSVTSAPYSLAWPNVPANNYSFTAKATDNLGATGTSAPVAVTVTAPPPNSPPTVGLTSPAPGASAWAPAAFTLSANAADSDGSIASVAFYAGTTLIGATTTAPYTLAWTSVPAGTYTLTAKAIDNLGAATTSAPVNITVQGLQLAFTTPADGAALAGDSVLVKGAVQGTPNSGVTVNGQAAVIDADNNFYATVPLVAGANAITATLTTQSGQTTTQTINVTSDGVASAIGVSVDQVEGVQSLTATFTVSGEGGHLTLVGTSGGPTNVTFNQNLSVLINYPAPGTYTTNITVSDGSGNTSVKTFVIVVHDAAQLDSKLKAVWNGMNNALIAGDKAAALSYMNDQAKEKYEPIFDILMPRMSEIVGSYSAVQKMAVQNDVGEYVVNRTIDGVDNVFLIYLIKGGDGVWRIDSM
ncbi:S-layer family protein [Ramlibacter sp. WS9]|uniref:beta strand repeat-containing protein n=1 Tax=Ramlibacter sp. WS9 TaxID=1882741 RepID=UPI0011416D58|nr:Ig-like domain-containing protein [Ramlibacter sp. WS9]ROZ76073.1 hypothetical protein EEB15_12975 [Ramlibacter sp. WS9]